VAARAAALRSDALGQRGVAASDKGVRTRGAFMVRRDSSAALGGQSGCGAWRLAADMRPHMSANFKYQKNSKISSRHKKNRYKVRKNLEKLMVVGNPIWNSFHDYNFLRFSPNFELFQRF
jgi:hypothetical protein